MHQNETIVYLNEKGNDRIGLIWRMECGAGSNKDNSGLEKRMWSSYCVWVKDKIDRKENEAVNVIPEREGT